MLRVCVFVSVCVHACMCCPLVKVISSCIECTDKSTGPRARQEPDIFLCGREIETENTVGEIESLIQKKSRLYLQKTRNIYKYTTCTTSQVGIFIHRPSHTCLSLKTGKNMPTIVYHNLR